MSFINENTANGIPDTSSFRVGVSDTDNDNTIENSLSIPWASDPQASYVYYDCNIEVFLDSGIAVHNQLPQNNPTNPASLSANTIDAANFDQITNIGVNLISQDQFTDIVQRMGHARYWFRLTGEALRVGYKIPIPSLKSIGGVSAIPYDKNPQYAFNKIAPGGNYGGVILWHAAWSLWYTVSIPPINNTIPVADLAGHISADVAPPTNMQSPFTQPDDNAQSNKPAGAGPFTLR